MIFYFSATGNSEALARSLASKLDDVLFNIADGDLSNIPTNFERLGFVFPVYGWNVPKIVVEFINRLSGVGIESSYTYVAMTCGDDVGMVDIELKKILKSTGLKCDSFYSVDMPNTYVCLPGFDVDSDDVEVRKLSKLEMETDTISQSILKQEKITKITRGAFPRLKTYVLGWLFRKFLVTDKYFYATTDCIGCCKCAKVCPKNNITISNSSPQWHNNCIGCLACYHHCPTRAIRYGSMTRHKGQYLYKKDKRNI